MNRVKVVVLAFLLFFCLGNSNAQQDIISISPDIELVPLTDSFFIHKSYLMTERWGRVSCNGLLYVKNGKALMIDTPMSDEETEKIDRFLEDSMGIELTTFIAGHFHIDCIGGLAYLNEQGILSYGCDLTIEACIERQLPVPQNGFQHKKTMDFNGTELEMAFYGGGHCFDNIVVWFPESKVLFGGCLVKDNGARNLGGIADAVIEEWDKTVLKVMEAYPDMQFVVPGHGECGGKEMMEHTVTLVREYRKEN